VENESQQGSHRKIRPCDQTPQEGGLHAEKAEENGSRKEGEENGQLYFGRIGIEVSPTDSQSSGKSEGVAGGGYVGSTIRLRIFPPRYCILV
jgi:hypothetical protein